MWRKREGSMMLSLGGGRKGGRKIFPPGFPVGANGVEGAAEGWLVGRRRGQGGGTEGADMYMRDDPLYLTSQTPVRTQPAMQIYCKSSMLIGKFIFLLIT